MSDFNKSTPLHRAVEVQDLERVIFHLNNGGATDVNSKDEIHGSTPLHLAAALENKNILLKLLESELVDVNLKNKRDETAFELFMRVELKELRDFKTGGVVLKKFIEKGANVFNKDMHHDMLFLAARENDCSLVSQLLDEGIEVDSKNTDGLTVLGYSLSHVNRYYCYRDSYDAISLLLRRNASLNIKTFHGRTLLLHLLKHRCSLKIVDMLIKNRADVSAKCDEGNSVLHYALQENLDNIDVLQYLLDQGVDINCKNNELKTPLFHALSNINVAAMKFLIKNGARIDIVDIAGKTPFQELIRSVCKKEETQDRNSILRDSFNSRSEDAVRYLMKYVDFDVYSSKENCIFSNSYECYPIPDRICEVIIKNLVLKIFLNKPVGSVILNRIFRDKKKKFFFQKV